MAWIAAALVAGAVLFVVATNFAAFRDQAADVPIFRNGTIAYEANGNIRVVDPDGSNDGRVIGELNDDTWHSCPRFHPDGRSISYFEDGQLRVSQVDGNGRPAGSAARPGAVIDGFFTCGARSPDGRKLTIHSWNESGGWRLSVLTLADGSRVPVADDLTSDSSSWAPDGSWLAAPTGTGIAIHDDTGEAIDVIEISQQPIDLDVNAGGTTLAYVGKFDDGSSHVFVVDRNGGGELQLTAGEGIRASPVWSPSGQLLAFIETRCDPRGCHSHVVVYDGAQKTTLPPAITDGMEAWPRGRLTWSPDGEWVLYLAEERTTSDGLSIQAPLIAAPLVSAPRVVTIEFGMASYDWQPLPVR